MVACAGKGRWTASTTAARRVAVVGVRAFRAAIGRSSVCVSQVVAIWLTQAEDVDRIPCGVQDPVRLGPANLLDLAGQGRLRRIVQDIRNVRGGFREFHSRPDNIRQVAHDKGRRTQGINANRSFTDVYQWGRRTTPLSPVAEIQHRLLPASPACEAAQFAVAGALEPADHVGGDTFDHVIDRDTVQLSVTDAMGHDVDVALLATLLVGALRRARRAGADLAEQARQAGPGFTSTDQGRAAIAARP